jgi:hypothetical protein
MPSHGAPPAEQVAPGLVESVHIGQTGELGTGDDAEREQQQLRAAEDEPAGRLRRAHPAAADGREQPLELADLV